MIEQSNIKQSDSQEVIPPDILVEDRILSALVGEGLVDAALVKKIKGKFASGSMSADDWRVDFELALSKKKLDAEVQS